MLKSLEKLCGFMNEFDGSGFFREDDFASFLAAEIQEEIDRYYLPRPLFEDGEPVQFGDMVSNGRSEFSVSAITHYQDGTFDLDSDLDYLGDYSAGELVKHVGDTQKSIDNDALMNPDMYCEKYNFQNYEGISEYQMIMHLLQRQRDLCARGDA